jgi:hypothetical protein
MDKLKIYTKPTNIIPFTQKGVKVNLAIDMALKLI